MVDKNVALVTLAISDLLAIAGIVYTSRLASWFSSYVRKMRSLPKRSPLYYLPSSNVPHVRLRRHHAKCEVHRRELPSRDSRHKVSL